MNTSITPRTPDPFNSLYSGAGNDGASAIVRPQAEPLVWTPPTPPVWTPPPPNHDSATTERFAAALMLGGVVLELRAFRAKYDGGWIVPADYNTTYAGWYDQPDQFAADAFRARDVSIFTTFNRVNPELRARSYNRFARQKHTTKDDDVTAIRWLFLDIDPERPADVSATEAERTAALHRRDAIRKATAGLDGACLTGSSGNGAYILARIEDMPNDEAGRKLIANGLRIFGQKFDDAAVKVDQKTKNPARIMAVAGSVKCKGSNIPERPWRLVTLDAVPEVDARFDLAGFVAAHADLLAQIEAESKRPARTTRATTAGAPLPDVATPQHDLDARIFRATKYLMSMEPAVSHQDGHGQTFDAACALVKGFDLSPFQARPLLAEWNVKCQPPWSDPELDHKLTEADEKPDDKPRGYLFDRDAAQSSGGAAAPSGAGEVVNITLSHEEYAVNTETIAALANCLDVFQRGGSLVCVRRDLVPPGAILRPPGSPMIVPHSEPFLRETITRVARYRRPVEGPDGIKLVPTAVPGWCVKAVLRRGEYPGIPPIVGVVDNPAIRPDGTILDTPGYDASTGLLYEPSGDFPTIPDAPTLDDASRAADLLLDLVGDFPFVSKAHAVAWLSGLLTVLARFAINGPCPLILVTANCPGSGKGLLCDVLSLIASGRRMTITACPDHDEEMRKRITSIVLAGDQMALLDNIDTALGSASLDAALTGTVWRDRVLGQSEMTSPLPMHTVWLATGNNVLLRGDMLRRVIPVRLETPMENPEHRSGLKNPDLIGHVTAERMRYLAAALTVVRAYFVAGRPSQGLTPLGSYEAWSATVRSATAWATGIDPCETRAELREDDPQAVARRALVDGWSELPGSDRGITVANALGLLGDSAYEGRFPTLRAAFSDISKDGRLPTPRTIGMKLNAIRNRVVSGKAIRSVDAGKNTKAWKVETLQGGTSGTSGTFPGP